MQERAKAVVVECRGEHDFATRSEIALVLERLLAGHELVVVDVSEAEFIDSSFIHNLIIANDFARTRGSQLRLQHATAPTVQAVLEMTGVFEKLGLGNWISDKKAPGGRRAESWVGFHTFRHTCESVCFRHGWSAPQVQKWLGHATPAFTLAVYVHLLPTDLPEPGAWGQHGATQATETTRKPLAVEAIG